VYGTELSPEQVSAITDGVLEEVRAWQNTNPISVDCARPEPGRGRPAGPSGTGRMARRAAGERRLPPGRDWPGCSAARSGSASPTCDGHMGERGRLPAVVAGSGTGMSRRDGSWRSSGSAKRVGRSPTLSMATAF
jgi:hypothetical protein